MTSSVELYLRHTDKQTDKETCPFVSLSIVSVGGGEIYSHKAGNQKGHAHQTWCLLFSNISMI